MKWATNTPLFAGKHDYRSLPGFLKLAVLVLLALFMLFFSEPSAGLDWSPVEPDSGELILRAPGLPDSPAHLQSATEGWNIYELGRWKAVSADWPKAQLFLVRMKDIAPSNQQFVKTDPLSESARSWFPGESLDMRQSNRAENELGELDTQRFSRPGNIECVAVEQGISTYSDSIDFDSGAELLGDKVIRGWYCVPAEAVNTEQVLADFVNGIGLKGFAVPSRSGEVSLKRDTLSEEKEAARSPITVAVFPFSNIGRGAVAQVDADYLLPEFAHQHITDNRQLRLLASYFKNDSSKIGNHADYWSTEKQPLDNQIYTDADRIGADAVLMYQYSGTTTMPDRFTVTAYIFDVKNRQIYKADGNQNSYRRVTESLFKDLIALR